MLLLIPNNCELQEKINEIWFTEAGFQEKMYFYNIYHDLVPGRSKLYCYLDGNNQENQLILSKTCAIVSGQKFIAIQIKPLEKSKN